MTNTASDTEQAMSAEDAGTDSEDEVLMKPKEKSMDVVENGDDTSDDEVLAVSAERKSLDSTTTDNEKSKQTVNQLLQLPVSRIRTIMKSSPELTNVKPEAYVLITRATELFVQYLAQKAHTTAPGQKRTLEYNALSNVVSKDESLDFLEEIVPFKIKMKDYWERYGYPKKPDDDIEIVEIDSNGTSNGHASSSSKTPTPKTPLQKTPMSNQKQTPKVGAATSLHNSASKTLPNKMNAKATKLSAISKTPTPGKTQKTLDSMVKPKNGLVNGHAAKNLNGSSGKVLQDVICIDD